MQLKLHFRIVSSQSNIKQTIKLIENGYVFTRKLPKLASSASMNNGQSFEAANFHHQSNSGFVISTFTALFYIPCDFLETCSVIQYMLRHAEFAQIKCFFCLLYVFLVLEFTAKTMIRSSSTFLILF